MFTLPITVDLTHLSLLPNELAEAVTGKISLPCGECSGHGAIAYLDGSELLVRECPECWGFGKFHLKVALQIESPDCGEGCDHCEFLRSEKDREDARFPCDCEPPKELKLYELCMECYVRDQKAEDAFFSLYADEGDGPDNCACGDRRGHDYECGR